MTRGNNQCTLLRCWTSYHMVLVFNLKRRCIRNTLIYSLLALSATATWVINFQQFSAISKGGDLLENEGKSFFIGQSLLSNTDNTHGGKKKFVDYVDPFLGTGGHGHTYPGVSMPFGMVQISPDNGISGWDWSSGYHYNSTVIQGISHTHLSGTGIADMMDVSIMPFFLKKRHLRSRQWTMTREFCSKQSRHYCINLNKERVSEAISSQFDHEDEEAAPGYYRVVLKNHGIQAELTATEDTGMHQLTVSEDMKKTIVSDKLMSIISIDLTAIYAGSETTTAVMKVESNNTITGHKVSYGWGDGRQIHFYIDFSKPFVISPLFDCRNPGLDTTCTRAFLVFESLDGLKIRVGLSSATDEGAKAAVQKHHDAHGWDFESTRRMNEKIWESKLRTLRVQGGNEENMVVFYTSLYHSMLTPTKHSDVEGNYRGPDGKVHQATGGEYFTTFSIWDIFRAQFSLQSIINLDITKKVISTMIQHIKHSNDILPKWTLWGLETDTMTGYHSVSLIAEAMRKGLIGRNELEQIYPAMNFTAHTVDSMHRNYDKLGYLTKGREGESVSKTLEYSFDDWCISQVAQELGLKKDKEYFANRSLFYRNLFDPSTQFFRPRKRNGQWMKNFDPRYSNHDHGHYTEGTAWQYLWHILHDIEDLKLLLGGSKKMEKKLDAFFFEHGSQIIGSDKSVDITGLIGQV